MIRIGVDAMGGDFAPDAAVSGAVLALQHLKADERIVLFGDKQQIIDILARENVSPDKFDIVHASEVIEMGEHPSKAFSKKTDSSIVKGFMALAAGQIDGFASAGSTGAMMVGAFMVVKQIPGVIRPGIAGFIPVSENKLNLILDVGLNPDCRPDVLFQYGKLGSIYAKQVLGVDNPRVALLNIGEEEEKGNLITKGAFELMKETSEFNFVGNVEGHHLFHDKKADVIVCDGFVGNVVLKEAEAFYHLLKKFNPDNTFIERFNSENYGGTPVLGVNKPVIIAHGASSPVAIMNMIIQTREVITSNLCEKIKNAFV
ncbi:phosphate acyltransferase PlsX [Tenuifilum thalassicum]|uniref:Phosphate acyltransferase n=1 Tax=Tenuifilum thalassicum TaxID=2590900 RepID=A0A7D3XXH4_9BACT|nr:phosphate acyltransferase PlsX [Tenuifilum thalassicum]QKG80991.1 phosphate acyltransferase PlsX [Tenuifilum thalassicum]